jgi:cyclohexa-1,5-dienecarbonyl-CoA hydratase
MSKLEFLKLDITNGIASITFNRPKHNVLNIDMMNALNVELEKLIEDETLKCIALYGEGPSWCAGVEVGDHKPEMAAPMIKAFNRIFELVEQIEVPLVAAVHGACLGGGMEVAIACDVVLASEKALFGQPEIKLGFFPPYAAMRLPQLVGPAKAIEICTTGKRYTAAEAQALGFVAHIHPEDEFMDAVDNFLSEIAYNSPLIIRMNKRAVKQHLGMGFEDALQGVSDLFLNELMQTEDTLEGIRSFEEKRRPDWKNK